MTRRKTTERTRKGFRRNILVVSIEFLVPLLALVGDFDDVFFFGGLCRPLAYSCRSTHERRQNGGEEEELKTKNSDSESGIVPPRF